MKTKICSKCKEEKPIEDFSKRKPSKDGLQARCKTCCAADKAWQAKNRGVAATDKAWMIKDIPSSHSVRKTKVTLACDHIRKVD